MKIFSKLNPPSRRKVCRRGLHERAESFLPKRKDNVTDEIHELNVLVSWYENVLPTYLHTMVVGECLKIFHHPKEHYSKITATLMPIFAMLTSGPLEQSLSPDPSDASDKRPIWDMESLVKCKGVLYVNLDSLSDNMIASASSMLLSDLTAYAGKRYNLGLNDVRISLYVDEASNVINQPLITSLLGFAIAYVSDDEIRRKVECLELEKIEIDEKISEIDAAIAQMEHYMEEGIERDLRLMNRR